MERAYLRGEYDPFLSPNRMKEAIETMKDFNVLCTQVQGKQFSEIIYMLTENEKTLQLPNFIRKHTNDFFNRVMAKVKKV